MQPSVPPTGVVLAFDFGLRRIGVAAGDTITRRAAPVTAVHRSGTGPDWRSIEQLLASYAPRLLVVGSPYNEDGTPGRLSTAADEFAAALATRSGLAVARVDERWSSVEAGAELKSRRHSGARRQRVQRADIDSLAAAIILERWLAGET